MARARAERTETEEGSKGRAEEEDRKEQRAGGSIGQVEQSDIKACDIYTDATSNYNYWISKTFSDCNEYVQTLDLYKRYNMQHL